jgi:hypothetical protein
MCSLSPLTVTVTFFASVRLNIGPGRLQNGSAVGNTGDAFLGFIVTTTADSELNRGRLDCKNGIAKNRRAAAVSAAYSPAQGGNASNTMSAIRF